VIPNDYCRCHDDTCPKKDTCQRFIYRHQVGERTLNSDSLWDKDANKCRYYIEEKRENIKPK
jgi:hypothetical protein